jgi:invasion protein IalB
MNTIMRSVFVPVALVACMSAFAAEPSATSATVPAATTTAATPKAEAPKVPAGYKAKTIDGETRFCRKSTPMGTRFPTEVCMTQAQYLENERNRQSMRNELQDRQKSYSVNQ